MFFNAGGSPAFAGQSRTPREFVRRLCYNRSMKRSIIWLLALGLVLPGLLAQERSVQTIDPVRSYDGTVVHQKTPLAAKVFEFRYPAKEVANAVGRYLQDRGGKLRKLKGLMAVSGIRLHDSDDRAYDVYYQVKGKGSGKNALSTLSVILAEPGEDILARGAAAEGEALTGAAFPAVYESRGAEGFFRDLGVTVGDYDHSQLTASHEKSLRKAKSRYDKLISKGRSLERKRQSVERQINDNIEQQREQAREVDRLALLLDQIRSRRRG